MSKKNSQNLQTLISKLSQTKLKYEEIDFLCMTKEMEEDITPNPETIYEYLLELNEKMSAKKYAQIFILKSLFETKIIDPLLVMVIRIIADEYKMVNALDCQEAFTLGQV
jgi:hypothetical protein